MKINLNFTFILLLLTLAIPVSGQNSYRNIIDGFYAGEPPQDGYYSMAKTNEGGIIICQPLKYNNTISWALFKLDSMGTMQWAKYYYIPGSGASAIWPEKIISLPDGSFSLCGPKNSFSTNNSYWHIDSFGNLLTFKKIGNGWQNRGFRCAIVYLTDSNIVFTSQNQTAIGGKGLLIKTNILGNVIWTKKYEVPNAVEVIPKQVINTHDGGILTVGVTREYDTIVLSSYFLHILKTDINGNIQWFRQIRDSSGYPNYASVMQSSSGDYYISTTHTPTPLYNSLVKLDSSGQFKWYKHYSTSNFYRIHELNDTLLIAGSYMSSNDDPALTALDTSGNLVPYFSYQSSNYNTLSYSYNNNTLNHFTNDFVFTENDQAIIYTSINYPPPVNYHPTIIKTDTQFHADCFTSGANIIDTIVSNFTIDTTVSSSSMTLSDSNYTYLYNVITINPNINNVCFLLNTETLSVDDPKFTISPNPSPGNFMIELNQEITNGNIEIISTLGQTIYSEAVINITRKEITLSNIGSGIYFIRVSDGKNIHCGKLIVDRM